jgi:hypothetical protein
MKTLFMTVIIAVLTIGLLMAANPGKAEAWHRGSSVSFSVVVPAFGVSIGAPYYYPGPVYVAPPYPYYSPYYGPYFYGPHFRHRHFGHRVWRGDWHDRGRW